MPKAKKATKAFLRKNNMADVVKARKGKAKAKAKARKASQPAAPSSAATAPAQSRRLEEMDADEFMRFGMADLLDDAADGGSSSGAEDPLDEPTPSPPPSRKRKKPAAAPPSDESESEDEDGLGDEPGDDGDEDEDEDDSASDADDDDDDDDEQSHKAQLARLKETQSEFYEFLKNNDQELLRFEGDSEDEEDEEDEEGEDEEEEEEESEDEEGEADSDEAGGAGAQKQLPGGEKIVTLAMVADWQKNLRGSKDRAVLKAAVLAFHAAAQASGADEEEDGAAEPSPYRILEPRVFDAVATLGLRDVPAAFDEILAVPEPAPGQSRRLPVSSKAWKGLRGLIKTYLQTYLGFLSHATEEKFLLLALQEGETICRFFANFPKLLRIWLKNMLDVWSGHDNHELRLLAFVLIRAMTMVAPTPFLETCLKSLYLTFVRNVKYPSPSNMRAIEFMENSVVELFAVDQVVTYQLGFVYIRQLAIHLRNAMALGKKDAFTQVYNWQYIFCLRVWARIIARCMADASLKRTDGLGPLVHPLVQVTIGAIKLIPTPRYFPLRVHCIRLLLELGEATETYIPAVSLILDMLECSEMKRKPKPSTDTAFSFDTIIKVPKAKLASRHFQDIVVEQVYGLTLQFFSAYGCSISFPELSFPATARLRKLIKGMKVPKFSKQLRQLLDKIEDNAKVVGAERASVLFTPKDTEEALQWSRRLEADGRSPIRRFFKQYQAVKQKKQSLFASDLTAHKRKDDGGKPGARKGRAQADSSDDEEDEEDEVDEEDSDAEEQPKKRSRKTPASRGKPAFVSLDDEALDGVDDIVDDFNLSDSD